MYFGCCESSWLCVCVWSWNNTFSSSCSIEALHEKKQTIITKDSKISTLQAQVEATFAEKETLIAKYEAIVKKSEGNNIMTL